MQRNCVYVAAVVAVVGLGAGWWFVAKQSGSTSGELNSQAQAREQAERQVVAAAVAQIDAESRLGTVRPRIQAAPRTDSNRAVDLPDTAPVAPPAGYTFVEHHGEVPTHRFDARRVDDDRADDDRLDWLVAVDALPRLLAQARAAGRDWSFGWIGLDPDARLADVEPILSTLGVVVEGSAGSLVRARLPGDRETLGAIRALPSVVGLGTQPASERMAPGFAEQARQGASERMPVFVTLMADDADGRWRRELERLGAVVGAYDADTRSYAANVHLRNLETVARADFVQFVEPVRIVRASHDTAVPAMGADFLRSYDASAGAFTGTAGRGVPVAVMDTGLNTNHPDIGSGRDSICGANFVAFDRAEEQDLWADADGHGTHVTGTVAGNGAVRRVFAGMAPRVGDIRFAKVLNSGGWGWDRDIVAGMDFLSEASECSAGGWSDVPAKPLIVNMSLAASSLRFEGRDLGARKLDAVVWGHRQLYVVAQANDSIHGYSNYGAAKNSLAVGAALDSGELSGFSSHGPTRDGRLAPNVVGPGVALNSPAGGGSPGGYVSLSGTSMASPAVAGVSALLMEAVPAHREQPALTRARLMASAIRPDAWFDDPGAFPADNSTGPGAMNARFGLGKVSALTSVLNRDRADGWTGGSFSAAFSDGEYAFYDIVVPEGASRLDVVLTWDEPPVDVIADAVVNDLDLWLDEGADCAAVLCGEHSSASRRDNVEWVVVRDPKPGTWRLKVAANRVYTDAPRAALAWTVIRGPSTPELAVTVDENSLAESGAVEVTVAPSGYVASGVRLQVECRTLAARTEEGTAPCYNTIFDVAVANADGSDRPAVGIRAGEHVALGDIAAGDSRTVRFGYGRLQAGTALYFKATAWNAAFASVSVVRPGDDPHPVASVPANDAFAHAETLEGGRGTRATNLLQAGPEPGEPDYEVGTGRPASSVWYRWKATAAGPVHFGAAWTGDARGTESSWDSESRLDAYAGGRLAGLRRLGGAPWGASFFAEANTEYVLRFASRQRLGPVAIYWQRGERPPNDRFDAAVVIAGAEGSEAGTNLGATLDPGEYHGGLGGTVWYEWTAPDDGGWKFGSSSNLTRVLVFSGTSVGHLRLVSGVPRSDVRFPAATGETYRIAVAAPDAYAAGSTFELSWASVDRNAGNDDWAGATTLNAEESSTWWAFVDSGSVEPGEPAESGVRTRWWSWTAPSAGDFTWRLTSGSAGLSLAAFSGESLQTMQSLGAVDTGNTEFAFRADQDQTYRFAVGIATGHDSAYTAYSMSGHVEFGPTPGNDAFASASVLTGAGTVAGSNRFATTEPYERIWDVGHSSLWWTFEAPAGGWYRFWVDEVHLPFALGAYVHAAGPPGRLQQVVSSADYSRYAGAGRIEVAIEAEAGQRFAIRLGTRGSSQGGDFTLNWEATDAPTLLRPGGRFAAQDEIGQRTGRHGMAFDPTGQALFVAGQSGLAVLGRNPATGALAEIQSLPVALSDAALHWDQDGARLLVFSGCEVSSYLPIDATYRLGEAAALSVTGEAPCVTDRVFSDPAGGFVYGVNSHQDIKVYALEGSDALRHVQTFALSSLRDAVISSTGSHVFATDGGTVHALARDSGTGELAAVGETVLAGQAYTLAVSRDDAYLFAFGPRTASIHSLDDPAAPRQLGTVTPPARWHSALDCRLAIARNEPTAADAFCRDGSFATRWESSSATFEVEDFVSSWQSNRYGERLPEVDDVVGLAADPEGRHAYLGTAHDGILIVERIGNPLVEIDAGTDGGYFRLAALSVSAGRVGLGPVSSGSCIAVVDLSVEGVVYDVQTSKWQSRADAQAAWADIEGTEATAEICPYTPTATGRYRLAVDMEIDGSAGKYASNELVHEAE